MILDPTNRSRLLTIYLGEGYHAACGPAVECGIKPSYLSWLARESGCSITEAKKRRAAAAVTAMLAEFKIARSDLCVSRFKEHVAARRIAIKRLHGMGFGYKTIADALSINISSVRYWIHPKYRYRKRATCLRYLHQSQCGERRDTTLALNPV